MPAPLLRVAEQEGSSGVCAQGEKGQSFTYRQSECRLYGRAGRTGAKMCVNCRNLPILFEKRRKIWYNIYGIIVKSGGVLPD